MTARGIEQDPLPRKGAASRWRTTQLPRDWEARVRFVLDRDRCCQQCGATERLECDHIDGNDNHDVTNLQALCWLCHRRKTGRQGGLAAAAKRPKRQREPERHPGLLY